MSRNESNGSTPKRPKPMAMVGAGTLASAIWKTGDEASGWRYRFNVFRQLPGNGRVSQLFQPADLRDWVKLTQVLAAVLADDGCLSRKDRRLLRRLAVELDEVNQCMGPSDALSDSHDPGGSNHQPRNHTYGNTTDS